MKCRFCGTEFVGIHSCEVNLNDIPALLARVSLLVEALEAISKESNTSDSRASGWVCGQIARAALAAVNADKYVKEEK